jgi:cell division protein FtsW
MKKSCIVRDLFYALWAVSSVLQRFVDNNLMLRAGHVIALAVLGLLVLGLVMVTSADVSVARVSAEVPTAQSLTFAGILGTRTFAYFVLSVLLLGVAAFLPVRAVASWVESRPSGLWSGTAVLALGTVVLLMICGLVYVPGIARMVNGSRRWVNLGPGLGFQPSEIAKWGMVALMSLYAARKARGMERFWSGLIPGLVAAGAVAGLILLEDLGTGAIIGVVAGILLLAGGAKVRHVAMLSPLPVLALAGAIITSPYRVQRLLAFRDPYADPEGIGYHTIQSLLAVAGGEGFGRGLGFGIQKMGYLPEDRTDFLFAVVCEELGIAGAGLVVALFLSLVWAGYTVLGRERSPLLRLVTLGIVATVGLQAAINMMVVTALAPTKGIALPLVSSGGTGWMLTAFSLGLLVSIDRTAAREEAGAECPRPKAAL